MPISGTVYIEYTVLYSTPESSTLVKYVARQTPKYRVRFEAPIYDAGFWLVCHGS